MDTILKLSTMIEQQVYFALWAEDIGQYLHSGYNSNTLSEVEEALRNYVSVDENGDVSYDHLTLFECIQMTGLSLDYSKSDFKFLDELSDQTLNQRKGSEVPVSFLK